MGSITESGLLAVPLTAEKINAVLERLISCAAAKHIPIRNMPPVRTVFFICEKVNRLKC
jgi:hypothetical protein